MKHVMLSRGWSFGTNPFPAFRSEMRYGRNQNDREFIGVNGVVPDQSGVLPENVFKVSKPRDDVKINVDRWTMPPFMGLTSWAAFTPMGSSTMMMGDTVLFEDEVNPAMSAALDNGLEVSVDIQREADKSTGGRNDVIQRSICNQM